MAEAERDYQGELRGLIDQVVTLLEEGAAAGVELNPLATIMAVMKERGAEMDLSTASPMVRMLLSGMIE